MSFQPPETDTHSPNKRDNSLNNKIDPAKQRRIMHIDMDAFFASVEQRDNPSIRGLPVIIGGEKGTRGVVSTCSYEAREFGVRSGMALKEAGERCPHGIFMRGASSKYTDASVKVFEIFKNHTPIVEPIGIDEGYLDITGSLKLYGGEKKIAQSIKDEIFKEVGLTCTIGIAHTKIFAKLSSGLNKPNGLTILYEEDIESVVYPLSIRKMWGIGEKTEFKLNEMGIKTMGDLATFDRQVLKNKLGSHGESLQDSASGKSSSNVTRAEGRAYEKSVGNEHTFHQDQYDRDIINSKLLRLSQKVGRRVRKKGFKGRTITLKLRYTNFETLTHRNSLNYYVEGDTDIYEAGKRLYDSVYETGRKIRLIGITISGLVRADEPENMQGEQLNAFTSSKHNEVNQVMDDLRNRFGEAIIKRGSAK